MLTSSPWPVTSSHGYTPASGRCMLVDCISPSSTLNESDAGSSRVTNLRIKLRGLLVWLSGFAIGRRVLSYLLTAVGCALSTARRGAGRRPVPTVAAVAFNR